MSSSRAADQQRPRLLQLFLTSVCLFACALASATEPRTVGSIERLDPAFDKLVPADAKMDVIGQGYIWCEGPAWVRDGNFLLWSDIPNNAIMRWDTKSGSKLFLKPSGYTGEDKRGGESGSNGLVVDRKGRLILCQHGDRRVARLDSSLSDPQPKFVTLADRYDGKRFNSPNDAVVDSHNAIYFTDPPYGLVKGMEDPKKELSFQGVYRISPEGKLTLLTKDMERPNGIALSPDEKTLYVSNTYDQRAVIMAYPLKSNGTIGEGRVFFNAADISKRGGACDGMTVDTEGNLWTSIPGGVGVFTPSGKQLGYLAIPEPTANVEFGGDDGSTLFIANNHRVLKIKTTAKGIGF